MNTPVRVWDILGRSQYRRPGPALLDLGSFVTDWSAQRAAAQGELRRWGSESASGRAVPGPGVCSHRHRSAVGCLHAAWAVETVEESDTDAPGLARSRTASGSPAGLATRSRQGTRRCRARIRPT
jgi:hypothetical protein